MKESEIRDRAAHARYLELVRADAERLAGDPSVFEQVPCPVCGRSEDREAFVKSGFRYATCPECDTLFVNPRPAYAALQRIYTESESTRFWVEEFFKPVAEARREKILRPRAEFVARRFPELAGGRIGDIGAGFGIFLEELRRLWPEADLTAIEPSADMAALCREKGLGVEEAMLEEMDPPGEAFDLLTAFELFEHLHDPVTFVEAVRSLLRPGGLFLFTTLSGTGLDIQVLWERSRAVSPPHHLNFANPFTVGRLLERAGMRAVDVATPGELDWDILRGALAEEPPGAHRFWRTVARHADAPATAVLQEWVQASRLSSHMRVVAEAV